MLERDDANQVIRAAAELSDVKRRTWRSTLSMIAVCSVLVWSPVLPGHEQFLGVATASDGLIYWALLSLAMLASLVSYQRFGSWSRVYLALETAEMLLLYGTTLWMHYASGLTWTILCLVQPSNAMFAALTKPMFSARYAALIFAANVAAALVYSLQSQSVAALVIAAIGLSAAIVCLLVGRQRLSDMRLEAERNQLNDRLLSLRLERERMQLAIVLDGLVGKELSLLAAELEREPALAAEAREARTIADELAAIARRAAWAEPLRSIPELAQAIERKCRPLCSGVRYEQSCTANVDFVLDATSAIALLRVAQELVRNAVTHGQPQVVSVELSGDAECIKLRVRDDGSGLSTQTLTRAVGGLKNAAARLGELGGSFELLAATELLATFPRR